MTDIDKAAQEAWEQYDPTEPIAIDSYTHFTKGFRAGVEWQREQQIPEGWVLMPVEPTSQMLEIAFGASGYDKGYATQREVYGYLIGAAPEPEEDK